MAAHVGGVDVGDGDVEAGAGASDFFGGSDDGFCATEEFAHSVAARNMPKGAVLKFSGSADYCAFAVAFDGFRVSTQRGNEGECHFEAEGLEVIHEAGDLLHVRTGEWIVDDGEGSGAAQWKGRARAAFVEYFFDRREQFSNLNFRHE